VGVLSAPHLFEPAPAPLLNSQSTLGYRLGFWLVELLPAPPLIKTTSIPLSITKLSPQMPKKRKPPHTI